MIRPYEPADLDQLLEVWYRASRQAHGFLSEAFLEAERREIAETWLPAAETVVDEVDGRIVGFLSLVGDEVGAIFVDPDRQGRGVGRGLMDWARAARSELELDVFEANAVGRRFYADYGFETVGRDVDERTGEPSLRLRLRRADRGGGPGRFPPSAGDN